MRRLCIPILLIACFFVACDERETAKITKVGHQAMHKAESFANQAGERLGLPNSVPQRVQLRLNWDKNLEGAHIAVSGEQGKITLSGTLQSEEQRQRAISLAESTAGVSEVTDRMTLR